ncbi:Rqc2 family fibronectin-binding protein [Pectinatus sottacetonis]|uniref:Rqc2 family fibronectin-binding protein n=1 Tax=Pectinatus sottacetonis TaxID=1002795 RepID=UPI0018C79F99|nr:NFACT RNA binding domain-containing protein [Pectinatus sottacetonis]
MGIDGFSLYAVIYELNNLLSGGRIDKISQPRRSDVYISVRLPGVTHILHISIDPRIASMTIVNKSPENPPEPPAFCMLLRKQLEGGRIAKIYQVGLDRIAVIEVDSLGTGGLLVTKKIYVELMGKYSNIILTQNNIIIDSLRRVGTNSSRVRTVLPQQEYFTPPKQNSINVLTDINQFITLIKENTAEKLYKAVLNAGDGFGPVTVKELLFLAGLPLDITVEKLDDNDYLSLSKAIEEIVKIYYDKDFVPTLITNDNNKIIAMAAFPLDGFSPYISQKFVTMSQMLENAHKLVDDYVSPMKEQLKKIAANELNKQSGKEKKLLKEWHHSQNAADEKIKADNIMTYQYEFKDHADNEIIVPDIYDTDSGLIKIPMDRKLTVLQNMQKYYHKYDKLRRAQKILAKQLDECKKNMEYLATIEAALVSSDGIAELTDIKNELIKGGYMRAEKRKKMSVQPSKPFEFLLNSGITILIGKNNFQNDKLTLKTAQPDDMWFHTKDIPGSHVIVKTEGTVPDIATIKEAALLAAYFSKGRISSKVPVDYTYCRFVKKPSGAKPGFVIFTNNKTIYVTPDKEKINSFLRNKI